MEKYQILNINPQHDIVSDKDFSCAFLIVYQNINLLLANRFFKSDIDDSIIASAICNGLLSLDEQSQKLHFLLSLVHKAVIKKDNQTITILNTKCFQTLKLTLFELIQIAVKRINSVRDDDGFLTFINNATVKKYDSMEQIVKEIYNSDQDNFKAILLELGIINNNDLKNNL